MYITNFILESCEMSVGPVIGNCIHKFNVVGRFKFSNLWFRAIILKYYLLNEFILMNHRNYQYNLWSLSEVYITEFKPVFWVSSNTVKEQRIGSSSHIRFVLYFLTRWPRVGCCPRLASGLRVPGSWGSLLAHKVRLWYIACANRILSRAPIKRVKRRFLISTPRVVSPLRVLLRSQTQT